MTDDPGGAGRSEQSSDSGSGGSGGPDAAAAQQPGRGGVTEGSVETGWLRPHARRALGRPRVSTILLLLLWISLLILYIQVRP
ncbi:hypothetical protein [Nocardia mexicana]|uniref:Uncharacterized protein n=1 Tax=Nocardia mexicana TaxID=279262 RepID=A0A370GD49_9NOCA|nr:hypothetical protein [Nocardia mexicana]RDI41752.1 hypothetical protein DFR68_13131 [Nocardia mexicana]